MMNFEEFYILGEPIDTEIGRIKFIKIKDYPQYFMDLKTIGMTKLEIIHRYSELNKDGRLDEWIGEIKRLSLFELSTSLPELRQAYFNIFLKVLDSEEKIGLIDEDNFEDYRKLIMKMNFVKEENINPNPEIQRAIERSKRLKAKNQEKLTFADMCSSIVVNSGKSYDDIGNWTIYQFYMTFYRIGQFKNFDTTSLFATVPTEKPVDIESWSKHIDLYEEENHFISESQFKKNTGSVFGE